MRLKGRIYFGACLVWVNTAAKKLNPLTRTPESKREWVVPHERVEVYQGPTALSRKRARGRYNPFSGMNGSSLCPSFADEFSKPIVYYQTIHPSKKGIFVPLARLREADSNESALLNRATRLVVGPQKKGRVEGRKHRPPELRPQAEARALVESVPLDRAEGPRSVSLLKNAGYPRQTRKRLYFGQSGGNHQWECILG